MSEIERKWWFTGPIGGISAFLVMKLLTVAGFGPIGNFNIYHWLIYFLCMWSLMRALSFSTWLVLLYIAPSFAKRSR